MTMDEVLRETAFYPQTDIGNAMRLARYAGTDLRYCKKTDQWFNWDTRRWNPATDADMMKVASRVASMIMPLETPLHGDDTQRQRHSGWVTQSMNRVRLSAMIKVATGIDKLWQTVDEFDQQVHLVNFLNGTVDLRSGKLKPHDPANCLTQLLNCDYDPSARAPSWESLVRRTFLGVDGPTDSDVYQYVQIALGYSLFGANKEHLIFFLWGPERCGKSKVLEIPRRIVGEYGHGSKVDLIAKKRQGHHSSETYSIIGKRIITISETSTTFALDESEVKGLTGDVDRPTYKVFTGVERTTPVTWTIWLATNDLPNVQAWDGAIAERVIVIPAGPTIPPNERNPLMDEEIIERERVGVLAWLVAGAVKYWHRLRETSARGDLATTGFDRPASVLLATETYRKENDHIGAFIEENIVCDPTGRVSRTAVLTRAKTWKSAGEGVVIQRNKLYSAIRAMSCVTETSGREFAGIRLRDMTVLEAILS